MKFCIARQLLWGLLTAAQQLRDFRRDIFGPHQGFADQDGSDAGSSKLGDVNGGFDADCSCATAGAVLGILCGARGLAEQYGFTDPSYKLSIPLERK